MLKNNNNTNQKKRDISWIFYILLIVLSLFGTFAYFVSQNKIQENVEKTIEINIWKTQS